MSRNHDAETSTEIHEDDAGNSSFPLGTGFQRRALLTGMIGLGVAGAASQPVSAQTMEFGGQYTGDPGSNYGLRLAPSNARFGLLGFSETTDGRGVVGRATASSGQTIGVTGRSDSSSDGAAGLQGFNDANSGRTYGFKGRSDSTEGRGALGIATADSGNTIGLEGRADSPNGVAVSGTNTAASGTTIGVRGEVNSADGYGLYTPGDARVDGRLEFSEAGTTSATEVVIEVDGEPAVHLDFSEDELNVINGYAGNTVGTGIQGSVIAGGGSRDVGGAQVTAPNRVFGNFGTIGGGLSNRIGASGDDPKNNQRSTIGGGYNNVANGEGTTVAGGTQNEAASGGTVSGGTNNTADGTRAAVPGGASCQATGDYSLAAGRAATASHNGAIVFGDSSSTEIASGGSDEVRSQSPVYAPTFNTTSARVKKTDVEPVDPERVLAGVESLTVQTWRFEHGDDRQHVGPMAGAFKDAFGLDTDEGHIASVDADGVALAAIQGLADRLNKKERDLKAKDDRIDDLESRNDALETRLDALEQQVASMQNGESTTTTDD